MKLSLLPPLLTSLFVATSAFASGPGETSEGGIKYLEDGTFTYEVFEAAVEHVDLSGCPVDFDPDAMFCRMTLSEDLAHIFVFAYDGDQPLMAVKSYELGDGFLPF